MKRSFQWLKLLLPLPLLIGVYGFTVQAGESFLDAAFKCVTMYVLDYGDTPPNLWVELARWTAPLATASGVVLVIQSLRRWTSNRWRYLRGGSVAVYGSQQEKEDVLAQLGRRGISGDEELVRAERYLLLGDESENFGFYRAHAKELKGHRVYLQCSSLPGQSVSAPDLKLFCPEEMAARLFWRERDVYGLWKNAGGVLRIVLLGFGKLGEELLLQGLQYNLFDPEQRVEYHVFGDCAAFLATHTSLGNISDPVVAHSEPWYESLPLLEEAGLVLVLRQEEQAGLLQALLATLLRREIDVFSAGDPALDLLDHRARLRIFPWRTRAMELDLLFGDALYRRAKWVNLRYAHRSAGVAETEENLEREWNKLDTFTRYSNISAADYHDMRLKLMAEQGLSARAEALPPEALEELAKLEHIRWCRYHYLNNWRYGRPENGANKDAARRLHKLLVDYGELSEDDKEKDRQTVLLLLSL